MKRRRDGSGALRLILDRRQDIYIDLNNIPDVHRVEGLLGAFGGGRI